VPEILRECDGAVVLERRLKLGTFLGIGLYVHWTFALMIVYVGYMARSEGWFGVGYGVAQLLGVFLCVTLHEYGHAMAARWFGVPTLDITLLPIGGVARLQRMPRIPIQEFIVAVAGPAVNVVIVIVLATLFLAVHGIELFEAVASPYDEQSTATLETMLTLPTPTGFAFSMLVINLMLVIFNMIPAFPMDGGRVLRSLLAMFLPYRRATYVASRVGLVCAAGMAIIAWYLDQPMPILIAFFVGYAGMAEARQVEAMETVRGLNIARSMIRRPSYIDMNTQLLDIAARWEDAETPTLPVVSGVGGVVGVIRLEDVAKAIQNQADPGTTAGMLADHGAPVLRIDDDLESVLVNRTQNYRQLPVVDRSNQLVGVLDLDSMLARGVLGGVREQHPNSPPPGFDAFS
jgi:Zn-dependent protease/CBS domain-containing protein